MTIRELYEKDNESNIVYLSRYVGRRVRHVVYSDDAELWSNDIYTIKEYWDDACGEGCCQGFVLEGIPSTIWWSGQLKIADKE